jgi:hypothetical protein
MKIFLHVDADPDRNALPSSDSLLQQSPSHDPWKTLISAINTFEAVGDKMKDFGLTFKADFFLRADEQIRALYGSYSEIFTKFCDDVRESFGVGWHPHLFRWSASSRCWHQEFRDDEWMHKMLTECCDDLHSQGFQVKHTKMGWCFHNNHTMKALSDLGIEADFSALPGARSPGRLIDNRSLQDRYDWNRTKPQPYNPSETDYQSLGSLRIREIPATTYKVSGLKEFLYSAKLGLPSYRKLDFSYFPSFRRMVPVFLPDLIRARDIKEFCELLMQANRSYVTLYLHPSDLPSSNAQKSLENILLRMISAAERYDKKASFADASELFRSYASD